MVPLHGLAGPCTICLHSPKWWSLRPGQFIWGDRNALMRDRLANH
jgi:hypothetical protein